MILHALRGEYKLIASHKMNIVDPARLRQAVWTQIIVVTW